LTKTTTRGYNLYTFTIEIMRLKTLAQQAYIGLANMGDGNYGAIGKAVDAASAIGYCKAAEIASNPRNQKAFF
jgi:hypothetical protein